MTELAGRVLVVDDDPDSRALVRRSLGRRGLAVDEAVDGPDALARIDETFYDAVLLDISMPGLDGFAVCARIRAHADTTVARVPVVLVSARLEEADRVAGFEAGADDFIAKPWNDAAVGARVGAALAKSRLLRPEAYAADGAAAARPVAARPKPTRDDPILTQIDRALERRGAEGAHAGTNVLVLGPPETGKSRAARTFAAEGLARGAPCLIADFAAPASDLRAALGAQGAASALHLFDGSRWIRALEGSRLSALLADPDLALWNLADAVDKGSAAIGQSLRDRAGGLRVFDGLERLVEPFGADWLANFVARIVGTASAYGGIQSLFVLNPRGLPPPALGRLEAMADAVVDVRAVGGRAVADLAPTGAPRPGAAPSARRRVGRT